MPRIEKAPLNQLIMTVDELRCEAGHFVPFDHQPVRFAPQEVIFAAKSYLAKTGDFKQAAAYVMAAYEFFRGCVCWGEARIGVPLTLIDGAFEWLEPANFDWSDFDLINFYAAKAGTGFADFGLDKSEPFLVDDFAKLGFVDSMVWQEDSAKLLLRPLRSFRDEIHESDKTAFQKLEKMLDQLSQVLSDNFVSRYLGYQPRFG